MVRSVKRMAHQHGIGLLRVQRAVGLVHQFIGGNRLAALEYEGRVEARQLGLDEFWRQRLPDGREAVSWEKVLELLVVNHLLAPASEFRVHRQWFLSTAMDELLNVDYAVAEKDRLYRCLDRVLEHKQDLFVWLRGKWADLFQADFEVLLYDLTSTYFEGAMEENPKAKRGYSRDGRPDCLQVVVALVVTTDGFPLAYEVCG